MLLKQCALAALATGILATTCAGDAHAEGGSSAGVVSCSECVWVVAENLSYRQPSTDRGAFDSSAAQFRATCAAWRPYLAECIDRCNVEARLFGAYTPNLPSYSERSFLEQLYALCGEFAEKPAAGRGE